MSPMCRRWLQEQRRAVQLSTAASESGQRLRALLTCSERAPYRRFNVMAKRHVGHAQPQPSSAPDPHQIGGNLVSPVDHVEVISQVFEDREAKSCVRKRRNVVHSGRHVPGVAQSDLGAETEECPSIDASSGAYHEVRKDDDEHHGKDQLPERHRPERDAGGHHHR